jgi:hypothetical protein
MEVILRAKALQSTDFALSAPKQGLPEDLWENAGHHITRTHHPSLATCHLSLVTRLGRGKIPSWSAGSGLPIP